MEEKRLVERNIEVLDDLMVQVLKNKGLRINNFTISRAQV